jgi:hypothetical protein
MENAIYGLYTDPDSAQHAADSLRAAGFDHIEALSGEPFEEYTFGQGHQDTWMYWIAACAGIVGAGCGFWLTGGTQLNYPLDTGGMPIVSVFPNGVIPYEMTMLFAILATLFTLLITAGLPDRKWRDKLYDPEIFDGKILIGVATPSSSKLQQARQVLETSGAADIKKVGN